MREGSLRPTVVRSIAGALALASCGEGSLPVPGGPAVTSGTGGQPTAPMGNSGGTAVTPGDESGRPNAAGTSGAVAGSAGMPAAAGSGGTASSDGTAASGGAAGSSGAAGSGGAAGPGGAAGSSGAAGPGGAAGSRSYSTARTTFGGPPRCSGFDVCESFETAELGALPSGFTLEGYGTRQVGVSADQAMRGTRSLKIQIDAQGAVTAWLTRTALGELSARHFGRAFVRIDGPAPTEFVHFDLFQASGPYQGHTNAVRYASTGTGVGTSQSNWSFIYNVQPSGNGAGSEFGTEGDRSAHPRVDDWMCLEWSFDASKQVAQYSLDGTAIDYLRIDTERAEIPSFDTLAVGFGKYQNTGAFLVYVDEVAFDGERIGCNN